MKTLTAIFIVAAQLAGATKIKNWTFEYSGNKLPNKANMALRGKPGFCTVKDGILEINTIGSDQGVYYTRYFNGKKLILNSDWGYTVEFRVKILDSDNNSGTSAIHIDAEDGRKEVKRFWGINFYRDKNSNFAQLQGEKFSSPIAIDDDFHVYRVVVKDETAILYIDRIKACSIKMTERINTNQLRFGDMTGKADGKWQLDYLKVYTKNAVVPTDR